MSTTPDQLPQSVKVERYLCLDDLPEDACQLLDQAELANVELGRAWFANLVQTVYPNDTTLRFYLLRHEGRALALLPLRAEKVGGSLRIKALSNFYTALYEPPMVEQLKAQDLRPLLAAARADFPGAASLWISPMDPQSRAYELLRDACRLEGWRPFEFFSFGNWFMRIAQPWDQYYKGRAGEVRNTIKRMSKRLAEAGGTLQLVTEPQDLPMALAAYEKVYAASWKQPEPFVDFVPGLLKTFAARGWLILGLVWIKGEAVAAQIWIVAHGRAEIYKLAYDEQFKQYSPGTLLTAKLMEHVFRTLPSAEIDYLIGDDPYKKAWMTERRERWGLVAYNLRTLAGFKGWLVEWATRRVKRAIAAYRKPIVTH